MNSKAVAKLLGISVSTVQRWVKHLGLEMERNEWGHFIFSEENIEVLKRVKEQLQEGKPFQDIQIGKSKRSGQLKTVQPAEDLEKLSSKVNQIESSLAQKADSVVTYQLLQHRHEIEELQEQIATLKERLAGVEEMLQKATEIAIANDIEKQKKKSPRKKNKFLQAIFWF